MHGGVNSSLLNALDLRRFHISYLLLSGFNRFSNIGIKWLSPYDRPLLITELVVPKTSFGQVCTRQSGTLKIRLLKSCTAQICGTKISTS